MKTSMTTDTDICNEKRDTPQKLTETLNVSVDAVIRWFSKETGVIVIGNNERMHTPQEKTVAHSAQRVGQISRKSRTAQ